MSLSDCPDCWDTPCSCKRGYLGSKIYEYKQLKIRHRKLLVALEYIAKDRGTDYADGNTLVAIDAIEADKKSSNE